MTTYPLATLSCTVDEFGISSPTYEDILLSLQASYKAIYGNDAYVEPDSQDGQWLGIQAKAIYDQNQAEIAVYNQFSPATAVGIGLSSVVKINGIARLIPSNSTAPLKFIGQTGTPIVNALVGDDQNLSTQWLVPGTITIPISGEIVATGTCTTPGALTAAAATLTRMLNPTSGWQSVTNDQAATPGSPSESDLVLRQRQTQSTSLPAQTILTSIIGNIENLGGVVAVAAFENDTAVTDSDGIPPHTIAMVVEGGDAQEIADVIGSKKAPGVQTYGNTTETYVDPYGIPHLINFSIPSQQTIDVELTITALTGYSSVVGDEIKEAISSYISALGSGEDVLISRLYGPALLQGGYANVSDPNNPNTYELQLGSVKAAINPTPPDVVDIVIAYNEIAQCTTADIALTVI